MATCESLITFWHDKSLIEPSRSFIKSSLTNSSFYIWVDSGAFESCAEHKTDGSGSGEKLTGSKTFRWHAAHFSVTVSYQKHTRKHAPHSGRAFVRQNGSLSHCMTWQEHSPVPFTQHVFCECGCESWKWTGVSSVTECGCRTRK